MLLEGALCLVCLEPKKLIFEYINKLFFSLSVMEFLIGKFLPDLIYASN